MYSSNVNLLSDDHDDRLVISRTGKKIFSKIKKVRMSYEKGRKSVLKD